MMLPFFDPKGAFLRMCSQGGFLDFSSDRCGRFISLLPLRAQLLPLALSLACPGKTKLQFILLDELQLLSPGAHLPPTSKWWEWGDILKVE